MGKSHIFYLTEELNNAKWTLGNNKSHNFENHIYKVVRNWCDRNYPEQYKIWQTPGSNDNGKDIILEATCDIKDLFGINFDIREEKREVRIYFECKSSDSYKIPYNSLAGNIKLSELDNIDYYVLVTNTTITPYSLFMLQNDAIEKKIRYHVVDQYLLWRFLNNEKEMIGTYLPPDNKPTVHAEYQRYTDSIGGKTRFSIYLLIHNYTRELQSVNIKLKTDHNWYLEDDNLKILLDPGEIKCHRMFINKRFYDGLDELYLSINSDLFTKTLFIEGENISHNFIPQLHGEQHNKIIDEIIKKINSISKLEIRYLFGQAGTGKTRITDDIINKLDGTSIKCLRIACSKKENIYDKLNKCFHTSLRINLKNQKTLSFFESLQVEYGVKYILIIDDIHNADESFLEQIRLLSKKSISIPFMIVLLGRNDFSVGNNDYYSFINQCLHNQLPINGDVVVPLTPKETERLIQSIVTDAPSSVIKRIKEGSNCIPLFIIQYIEYLLDISLVKVINRNTVGILNPENLSSHIYMPQKMEYLYQKRIDNLKSIEEGENLVEFLFIASLIGSEFSKTLVLNYFDDDENCLGKLIERNFLEYSHNGNIAFAHESIYLFLSEYLRRHPRYRRHISKKIVENKMLFFNEMSDFDIGALYCWTGNKKESFVYFGSIIEDIKNIDNYSSISLNPAYRPYIDEVYQTMYHHKMKEEYLKNALFSKVYLSLHFLTPYIAIQECQKIENIIEKAALIKDKESFKMALLEQKAHSYINMGALRNSESILQELLAILIYNPNSMDNKTKFDLYDKLTNLNLKYNNLTIATNYNQLAFRTAKELEDHKLLALAEITYAKIHLYRDMAKSKEAIFRADEHLLIDKDPRIQCHNNLSKIVIALLENFKNDDFKKELLKDTLSLLHEAENNNYANSVIRGYLLAATIVYFEDLNHALQLSNMGIDAGIRWGQANYMWHFYNLKALISLRKKESSDYVQKLFNTVLHLLQKQNLLYLGTLDFTYENILALSNVLCFWQNATAESDFYQKISGVSYSNSIFSCNYNCDNEICNFNCIQTTDIYKKEYKKIKSGKLPFVLSDCTYPGKDPKTGFYLLFC